MAESVEYRATHRFARISPTKVRRIADLIRRKPVEEALSVLRFLPNRGARFLEKVLNSAVANADDRGGPPAKNLTVLHASIDEGPRLKRIQPRARGMAYPIIKRLSHIRIIVG
ncbi:MAG TPA: 50S ribosomal protein L22 [Planctomycetia bacterium]|nr:50S ribosomal protein L22 [Planctomycetia bacterium]